MVTVLAIVGIAGGLFYTVFILNWKAFDNYIAQADLGQELDLVLDKVAVDGRFAKNNEVAGDESAKSVSFTDPDGNVLGVYTIKNTGEFVVNRGGDDFVLSSKVDFAKSDLVETGRSIVLILALKDEVFGRPVTLSSAVEIYPRNN